MSSWVTLATSLVGSSEEAQAHPKSVRSQWHPSAWVLLPQVASVGLGPCSQSIPEFLLKDDPMELCAQVNVTPKRRRRKENMVHGLLWVLDCPSGKGTHGVSLSMPPCVTESQSKGETTALGLMQATSMSGVPGQ